MIDNARIDQIKSSVDIIDLAETYFGNMKRQGDNFLALCPFHDDKNASLSFSRKLQIYKCFSCGAAGNAISLVKHMERTDFFGAMQSLAKKTGIHLDTTPETPEQQAAREKATDDKTRAAWANRQAADLYATNVLSDPGRLAYFQDRGFTEDTVRAWSLGYAKDAPDELRRHLAQAAPGKEEQATAAAETAGLVRTDDSGRKYEFFTARYIFPIHDHRGNLVGFGGRKTKDNQKAKYKNTPDTSPIYNKSAVLYGLWQSEAATRAGRRLILCEGYTDTIALHQAGFPFAVATCGTALTDQHVALVKRYADAVVLCFDNDEAGAKATDAAIRKCIAAGLQVEVAANKGAAINDPADLMQEPDGPEIFRTWIDNAFDGWAYLLNKETKGATTPGQIAAAINRLSEVLKSNPDPIAQGLMIKSLSKATGVSVAEIRKAGTKQPRRNSNTSGRETARVPAVLANMDDDQNARHVSAIIRDLHNRHGQDVGKIGQNLFIARQQKDNLGRVVEFLNDANALFAWSHNRFSAIRWRDSGLDEIGNSYISKGQFYEAVLSSATAYLGVSAFPYQPKPAEIFTRWTAPDYNPTGHYLEEFVDFFNPSTDADRDLIEALILTMIWGGQAGQRPLFVICPESDGSQQAIGKSQMVIQCARLVGGHMSMDLPKRGSFADGLAKQALEEVNLSYRVALIDNVTGTIRDDSLTQLITAPKIAGRASYAKQAERSNMIAWAITTNEPNLSTDIASRTVLIRLAPCNRKERPNWQTEIDAFIRDHRDKVLADCIHRLGDASNTTAEHTRFPAWDNAVLGSMANADNIVRHIRQQQSDADRDVEEITDFACELAETHNCPPGQDVALKLNDLSDAWNALHRGRELSAQQVSQIVRNALSRGNLTGRSGEPIMTHRKRNGRKVWLFRPWDIDTSTDETGTPGDTPGTPATYQETTKGADIEF